MSWTIEYYEQEDTTQPAEVFEDELDENYPELSGKLVKITDQLVIEGYRLGGGFIEKCRGGYKGLWEMRAIYSRKLAREFFGFDGQRVILLHGYVKNTGEPAPESVLSKAYSYWDDYQRTRRVSPVEE